jgi:hypothetical protein
MKVTRLNLRFKLRSEGAGFAVASLTYRPVVVTDSGAETQLEEYVGNVDLLPDQVPPALREKLIRLGESLLTQMAQPPRLELDDTLFAAPSVDLLTYEVHSSGSVGLAYLMPQSNRPVNMMCSMADLTPATQRLIQNLMPTFEQMSWNDLRSRLGAQPVTQTTKRKVLVSYRKSGPERVAFAKAVADRLGREGFLPWFDEWEIRAGDSLPREIGEGFRDVYAVVPVLTDDYPGGTWAREELETAITKQVQQGIHVIPILYERCEIPELLRPLVYVDCTDHSPDVFEGQFGRIIDALNELELNPYR